VHVRLYGLHGELLTGRVLGVASAAEQERGIGTSAVRTDPEMYQEKMTNNRPRLSGSTYLRVLVGLGEDPPRLRPGHVGHARILVNEKDVLWRALVRPVARFLRTEVWSWLP